MLCQRELEKTSSRRNAREDLWCWVRPSCPRAEAILGPLQGRRRASASELRNPPLRCEIGSSLSCSSLVSIAKPASRSRSSTPGRNDRLPSGCHGWAWLCIEEVIEEPSVGQRGFHRCGDPRARFMSDDPKQIAALEKTSPHLAQLRRMLKFLGTPGVVHIVHRRIEQFRRPTQPDGCGPITAVSRWPLTAPSARRQRVSTSTREPNRPGPRRGGFGTGLLGAYCNLTQALMVAPTAGWQVGPESPRQAADRRRFLGWRRWHGQS